MNSEYILYTSVCVCVFQFAFFLYRSTVCLSCCFTKWTRAFDIEFGLLSIWIWFFAPNIYKCLSWFRYDNPKFNRNPFQHNRFLLFFFRIFRFDEYYIFVINFWICNQDFHNEMFIASYTWNYTANQHHLILLLSFFVRLVLDLTSMSKLDFNSINIITWHNGSKVIQVECNTNYIFENEWKWHFHYVEWIITIRINAK